MESSQEKSLPASERKLQKARDDGQSARSRDLSHLAILGAGAVGLLLFMPPLMDHMQRAMGRQFSFNSATVMAPAQMLERLQSSLVSSSTRLLFQIEFRGFSRLSLGSNPLSTLQRYVPGYQFVGDNPHTPSRFSQYD